MVGNEGYRWALVRVIRVHTCATDDFLDTDRAKELKILPDGDGSDEPMGYNTD